jgi:hypothetical protein
MFLDDHSTDDFIEKELRPWIDSGFVSVVSNQTVPNLRGTRMKSAFFKSMSIKAVLESRCMKQALEWG